LATGEGKSEKAKLLPFYFFLLTFLGACLGLAELIVYGTMCEGVAIVFLLVGSIRRAYSAYRNV
jgi:hypothetical protein